MVQIYKKYPFSSAKRSFGDDKSLRVLEEDNKPKGRSRRYVSWKEQNNVGVLNWPSPSPDANPLKMCGR